MRIVINGGGPSGLYFALLVRNAMPQHEVVIYEQNPRDATYGFGIVLAERGLERFRAVHRESHDAIVAASFVTQDREIFLRGEKVFVEGGGYGGAIARLRLLTILQHFCEQAGVTIHYETRVEDPEALDADLVVGADGVNSVVRQRYQTEFGATSRLLGAKLAWYGTTRHFHYPILSFKSIDRGHFWCAAYPYDESMGTFVAECDADTWHRSGMGDMTDDARQAVAEEVFAEELQGHPLISNRSIWHSLPVTRTKVWYASRNVLIGDALHSAHPSIGSGTRIAMEDSISLMEALVREPDDLGRALELFRVAREPSKLKLVQAAEKSFTWYENVAGKIDGLKPVEFVFDFMMRTGRIGLDRLRMEYPDFIERYSGARDERIKPVGTHSF